MKPPTNGKKTIAEVYGYITIKPVSSVLNPNLA